MNYGRKGLLSGMVRTVWYVFIDRVLRVQRCNLPFHSLHIGGSPSLPSAALAFDYSLDFVPPENSERDDSFRGKL